MLETNLAWCYRKFRQYDQAKEWIDQAVRLASKAGNTSDLGMAYLEYAELELVTHGQIAAVRRLEQAVQVFEEGGLEGLRVHAQRRLGAVQK